MSFSWKLESVFIKPNNITRQSDRKHREVSFKVVQ
jgi:hypothetical protein